MSEIFPGYSEFMALCWFVFSAGLAFMLLGMAFLAASISLYTKAWDLEKRCSKVKKYLEPDLWVEKTRRRA